jgi:hemoglobin
VHIDKGTQSHSPQKISGKPGGITLYERLGEYAGLNQLVKSFYAKARYDPILQPVFDAHIHAWPEHIETITGFWARMTGGPSEWNGGMGRHFFLNLGPEHFRAWLGVWDENCRELLADEEAAEMSGLAHRIGEDLEGMITRRTAGAAPALE